MRLYGWMSRAFNDTYRKSYDITRIVNVKLVWTNSDEDSHEQFEFTYTKEDRPEAIVNAAYRYLYPNATTDMEAYAHHTHIEFVKTNAEILWHDDMKCLNCLNGSTRTPYLNGQCEYCHRLAKPIFDYQLDNNTTILVRYDSRA